MLVFTKKILVAVLERYEFYVLVENMKDMLSYNCPKFGAILCPLPPGELFKLKISNCEKSYGYKKLLEA